MKPRTIPPLPLSLCLLLVSMFSNAQTLDVGATKYTFSGDVNSIVKDAAGNTYVGGSFTSVGLWTGYGAAFDNAGTHNQNFAKVAGGTISAVIAIPGGGWYIGGDFTTVNGITRNRLARINADGTLHAFDPNMSSSVYALALDGSGNLYAGGFFTIVGGSNARGRLCKFDNTGTLTAFNPNMNNNVLSLAIDGSGNLYAGGDFTMVSGITTRNYLCKFDNTGTLTSFNPNMNNNVRALALDGSGNLYAGGNFTIVGGSNTRNRLCMFDNTGALTAFDPNINGTVRALALDGTGNLYVGGQFSSVVGSTPRSRLCKFDNTGALTAFNPNMNNTVNVLAVDGTGNLYAGGAFTTVGGSNSRIALCKFDNTGALTAFDPNMNATVNALAVDGTGNLYAGGAFTTVGGSTTRNYLCKFDNTGALAAFNPNMSDWVFALALDGSGNLYAGGNFTTVGGSTTRNRLCKFDNTGVLTAFNPNMSANVRALAVDGTSNLYAGGEFTTVGGSTTRNRLCKFDNTGALTSFDPNMNSLIWVLALDGMGNLYAGGNFTTVGGSNTRNRLCKFDNTGALTAFDPNMGSSVNALALDGTGNLYAGGSFVVPSPYYAIFTCSSTVSAASSTPTLCINTTLTAITHNTTNATGIGAATGLPAGVSAAWASNTITISGTPTADGTFNYSIPLTGGCGPTVNATGTITVTPDNTAGAASSTPTLCINTTLTAITHNTTNATGIGAATGLPAGVSAAWASNTITISGTPTADGTFNYSIPLTGGCGTVNATGTITVTPDNTAGAASSTPTLIVNTALTDITHSTTGATGIGAATGLPAGVSAAWASNTITISGTPTATGTFNYSIPLTGGCGTLNATGTITVLSPGAPLSATVTKTNNICNGECAGTATVTAAGGIMPYTYLWSNGQTTQTATGLCLGAYNVVVTDALGATIQKSSINILQPSAISVAATITHKTCSVQGSISAVASGGTGAKTFLWSTGSTAGSITGLAGNTYGLTVTDAAGCQKTFSYFVDDLCYVISISKNDINTCTSTCTGDATVTATEGVAPYTYLWSNGQTTAMATGLCKQNYRVTVTDANNIVRIGTVSIAFSPLAATFTSTQPTCNGDCDGSATVLPTGAQAPYTFVWNSNAGSQTTQTATGLCYGAYNVTITSANGCTMVRKFINVGQPSAISLATSSTPASCANDGTAIVSVTNGVAPLTYAWSNGGNTASIASLAPGTYTVTVTDANGCMKTKSVTVGTTCGAKPTKNGDLLAEESILDESMPTEENIDINETLRLNDFALVDAFNVYPNPNNGLFTIDIQLIAETDARLRIHDVLGRTLLEQNLQGQSFQVAIDAKTWTSGAYFVQLISANGQTTRKVLISNE